MAYRAAKAALFAGFAEVAKALAAYCRGPYRVFADEAARELAGRGFRAWRLIDGFPERKRTRLPVAAPAGAGRS